MKWMPTNTSWVVWLRRTSQTFFLFLFFYFFFQTTFNAANTLDSPVTFFFNIDPLVFLGTWISANAIPAALFLSLITIVVTIFFGRWFCGWICPFGAIHNFFTCLRPRKRKHRVDSASYTYMQRFKYHILILCLIAALIGINLIGWLDPFSFLYRAIATSVYPVVNWIIVEVSTYLYLEDPNLGPFKITSISEPIYAFLRTNLGVISDKQPFYMGSILIGALFITVIALNLFLARFWCRVLCPLGALLGVLGKNPYFRLKKDKEQCNNCRLCLTDCQGGAEPHTLQAWKPSECFYCWNCEPSCPSNAISFGFGYGEPSKPEPIQEPQPEYDSPTIDAPEMDTTDEVQSSSQEWQDEQVQDSPEKPQDSGKKRPRQRKKSKRKRKGK